MRELQRIAWELRLEALRMVCGARSGHLGGSFSAAEILTALYFCKARLDPARPDWEDRDRIFVSKGHCAPLYYAALARAGFFPREELATFRQLDSRLQGHPDRLKLPGVEMSSGPLGLGASAALGCALGLRLRGSPARVFAVLGDGEVQEGIVWEAALCAAKYRPGNLVFILDYNRYQLSGKVDEVMPLEPLADKWRAFGWQVLPVDGHDLGQLLAALDEAAPEEAMTAPDGTADGAATPAASKSPAPFAAMAVPDSRRAPALVLARTVKGRGVSFMENSSSWHGRVPDSRQAAEAEAQIGAALAALGPAALSGEARR